nr:ATP synthase F0 subunit 6 [Kuphus sp. PMS-3700M]
MMLLAALDVFWGGPAGILSLPVLGCAYIIPFVVMSLGGLFMAPGRVEAVVEKMWEGFYNYVSLEHGELNSYAGYSHCMLAILMVIACVNFVGLAAFYPALGVHWKMWVNIAFPCWIASFLYAMPENAGGFFANKIEEDQPVVVLVPLVFSEVMSWLVRPFTLTLRICMNMTIGQLGIHVVSAMLVWSFVKCFSFGWIFAVAWYSLLGVSLMLIEVGVVMIQSFIFIKLLLIYAEETSIGPHVVQFGGRGPAS